MIAENSLKLNKILTTLLEVTKFKYVDVDAQAIDFQEMLNKVRYHYMKDFMRENIDFKVKLALSAPFHSDRSLLNSIFQNLIDNSVQYARRDHKSFITVEVQSIEQGVSISVEDNGQGIEKQVQEKVFNMFFKHNSSSKGSGVGLYVVKNCVEKLKGDISFSSEAGQGTRFQIFLPSLKK
jgi:signal transduction histidine kinase